MIRENKKFEHFFLAPTPPVARKHSTTTSRFRTLKFYAVAIFLRFVARCSEMAQLLRATKVSARHPYNRHTADHCAASS